MGPAEKFEGDILLALNREEGNICQRMQVVTQHQEKDLDLNMPCLTMTAEMLTSKTVT